MDDETDQSGPEVVHDVNSDFEVNELDNAEKHRDQLPRRFVFGEFFAGMGGLSTAMGLHSDVVSLGCLDRMDAYEEEWNILVDKDYERSTELCKTELDHGHFAPPCRTLTEARRTDEHGSVRILRSHQQPEGWGDFEAEEANKIVERMVVLCLLLFNRGCTFAVENPFNSFLWLLRVMQKLIRLRSVELVLLHQCCYGAQTMKPTGILTCAPWMKKVRSLCYEVRAHRHLKKGLVGRVWSYLEDKMVWRSSLAAEYPCGLCMAWASSLREWLLSAEGIGWMKQHSFVLKGRWRNQLVRADALEVKKAGGTMVQSQRELREEENRKSIGGLRCARQSVQRSYNLRKAGEKIRYVIEAMRDDRVLEAWEKDVQKGLEMEWVNKVRFALGAAFGVPVTANKELQPGLWKAMLSEAEDCEMNFIPQWLEFGFPLGINQDITPSGAFPLVDGDTAAVEASRAEGVMMQDDVGDHANYVSFNEAAEKGQAILDEMVELGRAVCYYSWNNVVQQLGSAVRLTKLGCIVKLRSDGTEKVRIIVDSRRSGVNGMMKIRERVVLPRITDVMASWKRLIEAHQGHAEVEMMSADFKDAFNMLKLAEVEKPMVVVKGSNGEHDQPRYYAFQVVVFGLAPGPLLWGRVAAAAMRLAQSAMWPSEAEVSTFVDDPLMLAAHASLRERTWAFAKYCVLWLALGLELSWGKAHRGWSIDWIGFNLQISAAKDSWSMTVRLMEGKLLKLRELILDLRQCKGVVPLQKLQLAVGILGWVTSAMPMARPFVAMLWAAIITQKAPARSTTRVRKGLVFVRQVDQALRWLEALLQEFDHKHGGLTKTLRWSPWARMMVIQTDACPTGMGGFLSVEGCIVAYWYDTIHPVDEEVLGVKKGDPAFQSELELLALLVSLRAFAEWLLGDEFPAGVLFRADNTATLMAAMELRGRSLLMAQLAAEVALEIESMQLPSQFGQHVPGIANDIADRLSRMSAHGELPNALQGAQQVAVPLRGRTFYRSWQQSQ